MYHTNTTAPNSARPFETYNLQGGQEQSINFANKDFQIKAYFTPTEDSGNQILFAQDRSGYGTYQFRIAIQNGNYIGVWVITPTGNINAKGSTDGYWNVNDSDGNWSTELTSVEPALLNQVNEITLTKNNVHWILTLNGQTRMIKASGIAAFENKLNFRVGSRYAPEGDSFSDVFSGQIYVQVNI